jgi:hypothetical protein
VGSPWNQKVSAEIARLEGLLAIRTITEAREVAIRNQQAEYSKILVILLQQQAGKKVFASHPKKKTKKTAN